MYLAFYTQHAMFDLCTKKLPVLTSLKHNVLRDKFLSTTITNSTFPTNIKTQLT